MSSRTISGWYSLATRSAPGPSLATRASLSITFRSAARLLAASTLSSTIRKRRPESGADAAWRRGAGSAFTLAVTGLATEIGSSTTNVLPLPTPSLRAATVPPCNSTMLFTSASPIPSPPRILSSDVSACTKGSQMTERFSGAMPMPESRTLSTARLASRSSAISILPPSSVNFTALCNRFSTI